MKTLNTLTALPAPPLSQSRHTRMACPHSYVTIEVFGNKPPDSTFSARGTEIHQVLSAYMNHLVETRRQTDYLKFDELLVGVGEEAGDILFELREILIIDPERVLGTEVYLAVDERFEVPHSMPDAASARKFAAYEGTLDMVQLGHLGKEAVISDWKSYFQITDPRESFQARMYSMLLMLHYPQIDKVTFRLEFVRYAVGREIVFTREQLPALQNLAKRHRQRQVRLHENLEQPKAIPGGHCVYCPLLGAGECPLGVMNPRTAMTLEERVHYAIFLDQARESNTEILKEHVNVHGPVKVKDANDVEYVAEFSLRSSSSYPADLTIPALAEWRETNAEDLLAKVNISGLKPLLKAKKRAALAAKLGVGLVTQTSQFKVGKAGSDDED